MKHPDKAPLWFPFDEQLAMVRELAKEQGEPWTFPHSEADWTDRDNARAPHDRAPAQHTDGRAAQAIPSSPLELAGFEIEAHVADDRLTARHCQGGPSDSGRDV
jgi:hypothetical protein